MCAMNTPEIEGAERRVTGARCIVDEQRAKVARLKAAGADVREADSDLELFEDSLAGLEADLRSLQELP